MSKPFTVTSVNLSTTVKEAAAKRVKQLRKKGRRISMSAYVQELIEKDLKLGGTE